MKKYIRSSIVLLVMSVSFSSCSNKLKEDMNNPFLKNYDTPFNVPPFERIMAKHYIPAFRKGMDECNADIKKIVNNKEEPTFENTITALDQAGSLLVRVYTIFTLQALTNTNDSIQKIEIEIYPEYSAFQDEVRLNPALFKRVKSVYENKSVFNLTEEQEFLLENIYKGFISSGANLNRVDQDSLKALNKRLSVLTVKFNQNVQAETNNYKLFVTKKEDIRGLPDPVISAAAEVAAAAGFTGKWAFTTKRQSLIPFLSYAENRGLRKELYNAYCMRGNNGNDFDNNKILADIIRFRAERARLLGYKSHSALILEPRMAKNPENVFKLLSNLWDKAVPVALKERDEMQKIINKEGGGFALEESDWWYYSEKLRKLKFNLEGSELRPYFKLDNVRDGAFAVANRLFGITFEPVSGVPLPHPEAQCFEVEEADGSHLGILYMDFHPRETKRQLAWSDAYVNRHSVNGKIVDPVVTIVCNYSHPSGDMPALLVMDEVSALFHEFGHALNFLFSKNWFNTTFFQTYVAGDFIELPSQIIEKWAFEPEVLKTYARHYKTNEIIPASLIKKIGNSGYFNQGFETISYLAAALLDMSFHTLEAPAIIDIQSFEREYMKKLGMMPEIVPRYRSTYFIHLTNGYDSGYYSYIWAAVLDNDAFDTFMEKGLFDQAAASSFRKNILEKNGTMDALQMFVNFRGREPVIDPLLKRRGLN